MYQRSNANDTRRVVRGIRVTRGRTSDSTASCEDQDVGEGVVAGGRRVGDVEVFALRYVTSMECWCCCGESCQAQDACEEGTHFVLGDFVGLGRKTRQDTFSEGGHKTVRCRHLIFIPPPQEAPIPATAMTIDGLADACRRMVERPQMALHQHVVLF